MQGTLNTLLTDVRRNYWRKTLDLKEVRGRMTQKKAKEFEEALTNRCHMDFTEGNIRQFVPDVTVGFQFGIASVDAVFKTLERV